MGKIIWYGFLMRVLPRLRPIPAYRQEPPACCGHENNGPATSAHCYRAK